MSVIFGRQLVRLYRLERERGTAVIHFPSTTAETGGYTDRNASHESEEVLLGGDTRKWVSQQFVWSHPVAADALEDTKQPESPLDGVVL